MTVPPPSRTPTEAIALWRRTAARLERLAGSAAADQAEAAELREIAARIRHYEAGAPFGITFDRAAGLKPEGPGVRNWFTTETVEAQRAAVARYVADHCAGLSSEEVAKQLRQAADRLARTHGRAPEGSAALLADAVALPRELPTSARSVRRVQAKKSKAVATKCRIVVAKPITQIDDDGDSQPPPDRRTEAGP